MKIRTRKGNGVVVFIIIIAVIWVVSFLFSEDKTVNNTDYESYGSNSAYNSYSNDSDDSESYTELENPFTEGTGHFAGYEWAQENSVSSCGGNSDSFIEGCEEYLSQQ